MPIDTAAAAARYRQRIIDPDRRLIRLSRLAESDQSVDLTIPPNAEGYGRVHHFRRIHSDRWIDNPLPIDPACASLGLAPVDVIRAQVFQNAACDWRCWYCFVPFNLLAADEKRSAWISPTQMIDWYFRLEDRPPIIDLSGGEPSLTPEWVPWIMEELDACGLSSRTYLWSDDNLSTDYLWRYTTEAQRERIQQYRNYGHVACFKGYDATSFAFNTGAHPDLFDAQLAHFRRLKCLGTDLYAYATFTTPIDTYSLVRDAIARFADHLQEIHTNLPLRTIPLNVTPYSTVRPRLDHERERAMSVGQYLAIDAWRDELERRFSAELRLTPIHLVPFRDAR